MLRRILPLIVFSFTALAMAFSGASHAGAADPPDAPPRRIVSTILAADEILLELCAPDRIAALSSFVDDPRHSNSIEKAREVEGRVSGSIEQVVARRPDLIIVASYSRIEFLEAIRRAGIPLVEIKHFDNWEQIEKNIERIGDAIGEKEKSRTLIAESRRKMERVAKTIAHRPRPTVVYYASGWTSGSGTSIHDMIERAGGRNYAALEGVEGHGELPLERLLAWSPNFILMEGERNDRAAAELSRAYPLLASHPTVARGAVIATPSANLSTVSHFFADGVESLARLLHPEAFAAPAPSSTPLAAGGALK